MVENDIVEFDEKNAMEPILDVEMNQSARKSIVTKSTKGIDLRMVDDFLPCKFEGRHHQEKQQEMLNSAQDIELKNSFSLKSETCTLKVMTTRENSDTQLRPLAEVNQSLEAVPIACNDFQLRSPDGSVSMDYSGMNKVQQQQISLSERGMESKNSLSVDREGCTILISENQHKDETELAQELETNQCNTGIVTPLKHNIDAKFAPYVERNQSFDGSDKNHNAFTPSNCISEYNFMDECQQQQKQFCSFSEGLNSHGNSRLLENQLVSNLKDCGSMPETVKIKVTTPGKEQKQEISCSAGHVSSISVQVSSANAHPLRSVKPFPESNEAAERNARSHEKDISQVFPVQTEGSENDPKYFDVSQQEFSNGVSESKTKHPIPSSKSSYNAIEQLEEETKLNNAHIYPFICGEKMEDFNLKDISLTSLLPTSEIPFNSMELRKRNSILNNSLTTPKESSGNRANVNMMPCSQYIESKSSVPRNDQGIHSSHKDKLSQEQNTIHSDCHFNIITGLASHLSTDLISSKKKTESAREVYDHKGAPLFGNADHELGSNPEGNLLSSLKSTIASISDNVHDMTPLCSFEECASFNTCKSNHSCVNKNEAKHSDAANAVFLTPVSFISREDAISNNSQVKSIEHLNLCHERCQLGLQSAFQKHVRDSCSATPASVFQKQTTNLVDSCALVKGSLNSSLCDILHSEGNANVVERGQNQEEFTLQCPCSNSTPSKANSGCFIPQNPKYSVSKQSGPVKLNTEYSSALTNNNEEACTPAVQDIKIVTNDENVSLPLAEKEWSSILKKKTGWQNFEENSSLKYASRFIPHGSMAPLNSKDDSCPESSQFPYASVKMCPTEAIDHKAYHGRKRKGQEMENQGEDSLIKNHTNSSTMEPAEGGLIGKGHFQNSEGRMRSNKKPFAIRNHPAEDIMVVASRNMISINDKFSQGVEKLHVPLIAKPKTLEECLRFVFLSQPQLRLLQVTIKQTREDMNRMKVLSSQHFQALDRKNCLQIENKPILTMNQRLGLLKWLQHVVVYEKSKLQLLQEKKHELMKKGRELQSGCQEADKLKSQSVGPVKKATARAEKEAYIHSLEAEIAKRLERVSNKKVLMEGKLHGTEGENQKSCERTIIMKQELEGLGNKFKSLCDYYCGVLKAKSNADKDEITILLKHHIEKRSLTTLVLKDMQLWKVKEIKSNPGDHFIELSYNDVLCQRFVFEGHGSDLNVSACNSINNEIIEKVFPFMNASEVFQYVIGLNQIQKIGGPGSIWQAVRETSFLVGTLIDVLEEVQVCRMGLLNLSFTKFVWPADHELHLHLTFIDCTVGLKARVVLDMSNLRRAVYPCDVLPLKLDIEQFRRQPRTLLMPEELDEVMAGLKAGYSRIKDLCGRISKLIESKR